METYIATEQIMNDCLQFAKDSSNSNDGMYARRGQVNNMKTMMDRYYGKIAEWATFDYLTKLNLHPIEPDMKIYDVKDKSYGADIQTVDFDFHVKSCEIKENPSWVFQRDSDPLVISPVERDLIVVTVHSVEYPVEIQILKVFKAVDVLSFYDDLFNEQYTKDGKCALYWDGRSDKKNKKISELKNMLSWDMINS
jgi:hypothetical protein